MFSILSFLTFFDVCAQLKKLTLQKYVSHVNVMWPLPGPVPKIELGDLMCSAFPAKKKNDSFPLVAGIPGQIQLFSSSQPFNESLPKTGFAPELDAM